MPSPPPLRRVVDSAPPQRKGVTKPRAGSGAVRTCLLGNLWKDVMASDEHGWLIAGGLTLIAAGAAAGLAIARDYRNGRTANPPTRTQPVTPVSGLPDPDLPRPGPPVRAAGHVEHRDHDHRDNRPCWPFSKRSDLR